MIERYKIPKNTVIHLFIFTLLNLSVVASENKPNIVLIYADDQGWKDVGYQSQLKFQTPNLDRLAKEGMTFSQAYANAANCQPARACLLSGNYTARHHVFAVTTTKRGPKDKMRLEPVPNRDGLALEDQTIAEALKAAGYATGHFGKWHLYEKNGKGGGGALPSQQGFDVTYDSFGDGPLPEGAKGNFKGPSSDPKGVFDLSKQACNFMEKNRDRPFFVYLAHHAPHGPVNARPSTRKKIKNPYQACVYDLDASVGRILAKIKELKIDHKTLVIYTSDNGGSNSQKPLRGTKGMYYEGGIKVPMIAVFPGVIKAGERCSTPIMQIDFFPTFLSLAGAKTDKLLDGQDLLPLFKGEKGFQERALFWYMPGYLDKPKTGSRDKAFRTRPVCVIRKGSWKLHVYLEEWILDSKDKNSQALELYNLEQDISEKVNVAGSHPELCQLMLQEMENWFEEMKAPMPTPISKHKSIN